LIRSNSHCRRSRVQIEIHSCGSETPASAAGEEAPALHPFVRQLGSFFVEEAAPGFGSFAGVAVGPEGDSVEDSVVTASGSRDEVVELEVDLAEVF